MQRPPKAVQRSGTSLMRDESSLTQVGEEGAWGAAAVDVLGGLRPAELPADAPSAETNAEADSAYWAYLSFIQGCIEEAS